MQLSINGREYKQLRVISFIPSIELLDGEGTARTKAAGWDMIREPQGHIINFKVAFASTVSTNPDFIHFWETAKSLGETDFVPVKFIDPTGETINQLMYFTVDPIELVKAKDGYKIYVRSISANFVAKKGFV